ncbi:MAG: glycosyltransferase family 4 protein [Clostridia bacterium]|nr:glycosyltransferase family 4 protein [Clostridia bacterium]
MKILYSAFECNPYRGSEAFCGWSWVINMNKYHEIFVITRNENKKDIEKFCKENDVKNIHFYFCDVSDKINLYYKYNKFFMQYYVLWQNAAYKMAKKICEVNEIDIIHHITLGDFRVIGKMWKLKTNFVFGPLGGAQYIPKSLNKYSKGHKLNEAYRKMINSFKIIDFRYRKAIKKTKKIFCANEETLNFMNRITNEEKCELLTENGINDIYVHEKNDCEKIRIIWLGRIVYRKGIEFLIDSLKYIETSKKFEICLYGNDQGNEVNKLTKKAKELGVADKISFCGKIEHTEINKIYNDADFFVFPSLRETTGTVIFEALSHGLPIVGLNQNGLKLIANEKCAILVDTDCENIQLQFGKAIQRMIDDDKLRKELSKNAYDEIKKYTWENKIKSISRLYEKMR